jgi:hypothetical protein
VVTYVRKEGVIFKSNTLIRQVEKMLGSCRSRLLNDREFLETGAKITMSVLSLDDQAGAGEIFSSTAFVKICCPPHPVSCSVGIGV